MNDEDSCKDWAQRHLSDLLWKTAKVEVHGLTLPDTESILRGMTPETPDEIRKYAVVVNLKRAWRRLLDDVDQYVDLFQITEYNRILGQGIVYNAGRMRTGGVRVDDYVPPIPTPDRISTDIFRALDEKDPVRRALHLYAVTCRGQWFMDGNKRTAAMAANHSLIHDGGHANTVMAIQPNPVSDSDANAMRRATNTPAARAQPASSRPVGVTTLDSSATVWPTCRPTARNGESSLLMPVGYASRQIPQAAAMEMRTGRAGAHDRCGRVVGPEVQRPPAPSTHSSRRSMPAVRIRSHSSQQPAAERTARYAAAQAMRDPRNRQRRAGRAR